MAAKGKLKQRERLPSPSIGFAPHSLSKHLRLFCNNIQPKLNHVQWETDLHVFFLAVIISKSCHFLSKETTGLRSCFNV